jgi:hypothetical protein
MRHLTGFILAVMMSAALFFGGGWGVARIMALHGPGQALESVHGALALAALAGVGLLLGILLAAPGISPLGAGLPGLLLLAWSGLLVVSARHAISLIPLHGTRYAAGFTTLLVSGILVLAGAVMIVPLFVPSRWRRRMDDDDDDISMPEAIGLRPSA